MKSSPPRFHFSADRLRAREAEQALLLEEARAAREAGRGNQVFVRAVVEVSNFCRQDCCYCGMRRSNRDLKRFRIELDLLRKIIFENLPDSVTDINLQGGEDPVVVREVVLPLIAEIASKTSLGISLCLGTLSPELYRELQNAGGRYYIIKIETGDGALYRKLKSPGTLEKRLEGIRHLAKTGWQVSSGLICGLPGQDEEGILQSMDLLAGLPLAGYSVSPFIPGADTPLGGETPADLNTAINCLALMRLAHPSHIIPAVSAFNILDSQGYVSALRAGANLTTINLTPEGWRENYLLYKRDRFIMTEQRVLAAIEKAGCEPSRTSLVKSLAEAKAA